MFMLKKGLNLLAQYHLACIGVSSNIIPMHRALIKIIQIFHRKSPSSKRDFIMEPMHIVPAARLKGKKKCKANLKAL